MMTRQQQITEALKLLDPPRGKRTDWQSLIEDALDQTDGIASVTKGKAITTSPRGKEKLQRYVAALRRVRDAHKAIDGFDTLTSLPYGFLVPMVISNDIRAAEALLHQPSQPRARPVNMRARYAAGMAVVYIIYRGCKVTTERNGRCHRLAQVIANTKSDLRRHISWFLVPRRASTLDGLDRIQFLLTVK